MAQTYNHVFLSTDFYIMRICGPSQQYHFAFQKSTNLSIWKYNCLFFTIWSGHDKLLLPHNCFSNVLQYFFHKMHTLLEKIFSIHYRERRCSWFYLRALLSLSSFPDLLEVCVTLSPSIRSYSAIIFCFKSNFLNESLLRISPYDNRCFLACY